MIEKKEIDDDKIKEVIHELELILFCKKRKNISKNDFIYFIYQFLIINSIKEESNFI